MYSNCIIRLFQPSEVWELQSTLMHRETPLPGFTIHVSFPGFAVQVQVYEPMPGQACELSNLGWDLRWNLYCNMHISYSSASTVEINATFKVLTGLMAKQAQAATSSDLVVSSFSSWVIASRGLSWQVDVIL